MGDRKVEENCLNRAIELALKQCGWTKRFAKRLYAGVQDGFKEVDRVRPDFVVLCPPTENEKSTLIGIEHFRVDMHVTQKKTTPIRPATATLKKAPERPERAAKRQATALNLRPFGRMGKIASFPIWWTLPARSLPAIRC